MDFLPYGRQTIEEDDIAAVAEALRGDYLTTGPKVEAFEMAFAQAVGAAHAVACSNGTASLHLAMLALGVGPGDTCIVPSITFLATANCAAYVGARVVFADVDPDSGLMTPATLAAALARADGPVRAVLPVHLRGDVCDLPALARLAAEAGAVLVEDAPHALGTTMDFGAGRERVGDCAHAAMASFSFHPVKTIATGEGGMITTNDAALAARLRTLRSHGMTRPPGAEPWVYEMAEPGFNYRLADINSALGLSQLSKLDRFTARRRALAALYAQRLGPLSDRVAIAARPAWSDPALHLFCVLIDFDALGVSRAQVMQRLAEAGVGSQVHYIPVDSQPYWRAHNGELDLPGASAWYARCLSLPLFPGMAESDVDRVVSALEAALRP
ncbi:UDP-4-amino-4,6-dideoxy-N-acetyl-beta-L-altrosamine transaminase [Caulobacter sp. SLTY]|uniref:UDP-4-amino-4, 6-dideoxy-N-acetyl-beta-L-altrosamine transaminase n=1 Tax=Caulobacter sp. SLTY TaxID=2683262 RepID=UPI001411C5D3|nr:UDP-4-amino-4,6-dideoxy-N-acetyl-beta-L-altrosamine transaminase [Caulobacter sp. SLTY]NBB13884.1 UDP-4-amino-4,6-dideoxy-N-acetyl-beta-L-altrosamine transaminase [Caulobacter sp. SLTY]